MKKKKNYSEEKYKLKLNFKEKTLLINISTYRDYRGVTGKDLDSDTVERLFKKNKIDPELPEDKLAQILRGIIQELKKQQVGFIKNN